MKYTLIIIIIIAACNNNNKHYCRYKLTELLINERPKVSITFQNDSIIQAQDNVKGTSFNTYTFDKNGNLKLYAFLVDSNNYKYLEEYDDTGLIKKIGSPLVEYRLWKKNSDTVSFSLFLFGLNKKYDNLEVVTNKQDTIIPKVLYKSDFHTNMKCFSFELPVAKNLRELILFTQGSYIDSCNNKMYSFKDTIMFDKTIL